MGFSSRTVVTVLDALEKDLMLQRQQSPTDRRGKHPYITEKRLGKLHIAQHTPRTTLGRFLSPLSQTPLVKLCGICHNLELSQ
ncbi:hypothetical protein [Sodalis ligni]|uniref:hypothetical protein n=1 Tax=Sodalis ligni TaxID=2697027 RepID=UPI003B84A51C